MTRETKRAYGITRRRIMLAAGLTTAATGSYFLLGKRGEKNRMKVRDWMIRMKSEIRDQVERMGALNETAYRNIVDAVASRYESLKHINQAELEDFVAELKKSWRYILATGRLGRENTEPTMRRPRAVRTQHTAPNSRKRHAKARH